MRGTPDSVLAGRYRVEFVLFAFPFGHFYAPVGRVEQVLDIHGEKRAYLAGVGREHRTGRQHGHIGRYEETLGVGRNVVEAAEYLDPFGVHAYLFTGLAQRGREKVVVVWGCLSARKRDLATVVGNILASEGVDQLVTARGASNHRHQNGTGCGLGVLYLDHASCGQSRGQVLVEVHGSAEYVPDPAVQREPRQGHDLEWGRASGYLAVMSPSSARRAEATDGESVTPAADVVVVHYNEIALKLGHRPMFMSRLVDNIGLALGDLGGSGSAGTIKVSAVEGRIVVRCPAARIEAVCRRLGHVPGIANLMPALCCAPTMDNLEATVSEMLGHWRPKGSFKVEARRADKAFRPTSPEIASRLGAMVVAATGAPVDLSRPDSVLYVEVLSDVIHIATAKLPGAGGLPLPTGGRVLLLLSGGIDSPVAGLRMMRRGCRIDALHFHSVPYLDGSSREKARRLAALVARGQLRTRLTEVAFGDIQSEIVATVPRPLRVVLYRRMMMRIAGRIARQAGLAGLVTGESLGQVASQTMANLCVIEQASELPVLRPLVGMDKLEIIDYARRAGTYETSIIPDQDCCTLFVPKHPATAATLEEVAAAEAGLDVERMVATAVSTADRSTIEAVWDGPS